MLSMDEWNRFYEVEERRDEINDTKKAVNNEHR